MGWKNQLNEMLPLLGHRNWILVVDKAYPMQSAPGIKTIYTNERLLYVLKYVLKAIRREKHTNPIVYTDKELLFMRDDLCEGVDEFKSDLTRVLSKSDVQVIPHDEIFARLDAASKLFNVLVVKSDCLMPYTSVFIELDCGYWQASREKTLRDRIS
jgi:D-ribose pyranose/furanose isomerase RbsD